MEKDEKKIQESDYTLPTFIGLFIYYLILTVVGVLLYHIGNYFVPNTLFIQTCILVIWAADGISRGFLHTRKTLYINALAKSLNIK